MLALTTGVKPVMRVRYEREAYVSRAGDPVRVTFDTMLRGSFTTSCELSLDAGRWTDIRVGGVILEIKFTDHFPTWIGDLVRMFQLQKRSVAKYVMCILHGRPGGLGRAVRQAGLPRAMEVHKRP